MQPLLNTRILRATLALLAVLLAVSLALVSCGSPQTPEQPPVPTPVIRLTATPAPTQAPEPTQTPTPEAEGARYTHRVLATGEIGVNEYSPKPPGQSTVLEREFPGAPPLVPHSLSGLNITKDQNPCLTCHAAGLSFGPGHTATKIPDSHYTDIPTGIRAEEVQAIRYNCVICHIPQSSEPPL